MNAEDRLLFTLTRQSFRPFHQAKALDICRHNELRWEMVYAIAKAHGVAPLVYSNICQCHVSDLNVPQDIVDRFKRGVAANILKKEMITNRLIELLSFFNRNAIDVMLIKGAALDILVYEQPWYTELRDVDLIVRAGKEDLSDTESAELLKMCRGFPVECDFYDHHDVSMNKMMPVDFQQIWADATLVKFRGQDVFVMSPEDLLIAACINSCRKRFFKLKALCDVAAIFEKYDHLNWENLVNKAHKYDCRTIVFTALLTTEMTVGCRIPAGVLDDLAAGPLRTTLIRYLSRRMSWSSLSSLYSGQKILGRIVNPSLILPYLTYRWYQVGRKIKFVFKKRAPIIEPNVFDWVRP